MSAATALAKKSGEARLAARMPRDVQEKIKEAATILGSTLNNQFLVSAALDKANAVLERERTIKLNFESAKIVHDLIANPPEPNEALVEAMQKRRNFLENNTSPSKPRSE